MENDGLNAQIIALSIINKNDEDCRQLFFWHTICTLSKYEQSFIYFDDLMKNRKEYILEKAFDVFMSKGYDSVSITVLQKELGMSRGAMYPVLQKQGRPVH